MVIDTLTKNFDLKVIDKSFRGSVLSYPRTFLELFSLKGYSDLWIRDTYSTISLRRDRTSGKNLLLFYHLDRTVSRYPLLRAVLDKMFYDSLNQLDHIVVISEYWKEHFNSLGYDNVKIIYCGFNIDEFVFTQEEIDEFRNRFNLTSKPIIYIGNPQIAKGVLDVYRVLKDMDVHLVTSGKCRINLPSRIINLDLPYKDYLRLLKASSAVVTMSKFREGWCMVTHEGMLCKKPVIGSGLGGMRELLENGKQIVCEDIGKLRGYVEQVMDDETLGEKGYEYAKQFTMERFENEWVNFIRGITN
jgi:glycosyltransferase involved in cell wall biosynthesis